MPGYRKTWTQSLAAVDKNIAATIYYVGTGAAPKIGYSSDVATGLDFEVGGVDDPTVTKKVGGTLAVAGQIIVHNANPSTDGVSNILSLANIVNMQVDANGRPTWRMLLVGCVGDEDISTAQVIMDIAANTVVGENGVNLLWDTSAILSTFLASGPESDTNIPAGARDGSNALGGIGQFNADARFIQPGMVQGQPTAARLTYYQHYFDAGTADATVYACTQNAVGRLLHTFGQIAAATASERGHGAANAMPALMGELGERIVLKLKHSADPTNTGFVSSASGFYGDLGAVAEGL